MSKNLITISATASVSDAAKVLVEKRIGGLPVIDASGKFCGILSEDDLLPKLSGVPFTSMKMPVLLGEAFSATEYEQALAQFRSCRVGEVMATNVPVVAPETLIGDAAVQMTELGVKRLPVVDNGVLVGMVTRSDLVRGIAQLAEESN